MSDDKKSSMGNLLLGATAVVGIGALAYAMAVKPAAKAQEQTTSSSGRKKGNYNANIRSKAATAQGAKAKKSDESFKLCDCCGCRLVLDPANDKYYATLNCGHGFHVECIEELNKRGMYCSICERAKN